jgi:Zn-dependent protease
MPSMLDRLQAIDRPPPSAGPPSPTKKRGVIASALVAIGLVLAKFKGALFVLLTKGKLLLGLLQLGKVGATAWTMVLVAAIYSRYYGAGFAIGLVVLTLIHELGHGAAARRMGLPVGAPVFIPFFGAMIALRTRPRSTWEDFVIGAGGPIAGSAGGALCLVGSFTGAGLLFAVGYFALVMNLFNLMNVWQLDGARMCAPVRRRDAALGNAWLLAVVIATAIAGGALNPVTVFVVALGIFQVARAWWHERRPRTATALEQLDPMSASRGALPGVVSPAQQRVAALVYFGLATALVAATHLLQARLPHVVD